MRFRDKVFAITGAAQGIGRRVAERAAQEGASVAVIDRSPIGAEVADAITAAGGQAVYFSADLETYSGSHYGI
ncbi:SDR family NAD(P)-dependent oxidoreductase [Paracoccus liaowanqingii]|uniref:SDR family NAD(P)-dependent oxidoreductase n=1 Tax=Paracoccus liaowanqingii TaxID=2560053 RepID=A0A4P7HIM6_9RHOB|nr:SDR family NAD(P)-dependent oxidoreductase [Paracoccus liaowanqingii]QBX33948.1 SDR family NAD(P)-dependent oxidoreductase [Paracoccus liaowanqingii]